MATEKIAYVDTTFTITVRVPVDLSELPADVKEGDEINDKLSSDAWNKIVNASLDVMDGPDGGNIESMVVSEIEGEDDDPDDLDDEDSPLEDMYNEDPDYIHDAALDWMDEHRYFLDDIGEDAFVAMCADRLAEEGYNTEDYYWAVEEAFDDLGTV